MKRFLSFILVLLTIVSIIPSNIRDFFVLHANASTETGFITPSKTDERNEDGKHLILNADGSYGGTLFDAKYGTGAPLNGEYDIKNSEYYMTDNDFYNMPSDAYRTLIPHFSSYQQTMADTSGIACLMMVLNYLGEDVHTKYSELALLEKYEDVNKTTVFGKGTTPKQMIALIESLGLNISAAREGIEISDSLAKAEKQTRTKEFLQGCLADGKFVLVRYNAPNGFGWKVVIGYDTQGNVTDINTEKQYDYFGDDVIIFADPFDCYDHKQDGYSIIRAQEFLVWWRNINASGSMSSKYSYIVIDPNISIDHKRENVDEAVKQMLFDLHLPRNPDGSYGGTRDKALYGTVTSGNGYINHTNRSYYKINDFYNMGSVGTRMLLSGYTVLQQTMSSSCAICAVNSVLKYYGTESESHYDLELSYLNLYESLNPEIPVKGNGSSARGHDKTLESMGYIAFFNSSAVGSGKKFLTYEEYISFLLYNLQNGRPICCGTYLGSGHYMTVIGYDDMGTDFIYDDVIITANSSDCRDGYQDGYNIYPAMQFFAQHTNSSISSMQNMIVVYKK